MMARIEQARRSVRDLTESIEQMRLSRDAMVVDIDRFQAELQVGGRLVYVMIIIEY